MTRVLAIGLDAVERSFLERLLDEDELPHLRRLRDRSTIADLETAGPYRSEYPWTEFVSGRPPDALRYWSTLRFDPIEYRCEVVGAAPVTPFYALGAERRVIALDVPHSRLSSELHGAQVIGWGAHDPQFPRCSRPAGLLAELEREHGQHPGIPIEYMGSWHQPEFLDVFAAALLDGLERRVDVVRALVERVPDWDLLLLAMGEAHTAGHQMWHGVDGHSPLHDAPTAQLASKHLRAIHHAIDRSIGEIVSSVPSDTTVVIFSVKGMEAADVDVVASVLAPELLHRIMFGRSLLRTPRWSVGASAIVPDPSMRPALAARLSFADGPRDRFARYVRSNHPAALARVRRRHLAQRTIDSSDRTPPPIRDDVPLDELQPDPDSVDSWHGACWYQRYWPRMPAFVIPSFSDLHVRINLEGRERSGQVPLGDYERACARVEDILHACVDPRTDRPVIGEIVRMRADDPMAADGPSADLVAKCAQPTDVLTHPEAGTIGPFPYPRVGSHTPHGFAWFSGANVEPRDLGTRPAIDLPPTLLELLGVSPDRVGVAGRSMLP
jgi:predicted AlkP superfamily phosphohydrolase/phosphomutase